jgi:ATPase subunit of ABC transporter with duplicated ATPase domains
VSHASAGNYDTFCKTVKEDEVIQQKKYQKEQDDIKHLKEFIASAGTYANLVKQICLPWLLSLLHATHAVRSNT